MVKKAYCTNPARRGAAEYIHGLLEANSQTFAFDAIVDLDASGNLIVAPTNSESVAGFAKKAATNVTSGNAEIPLEEIKTGMRYSIPCANAGTPEPASSYTPGVKYPIYLHTDGVHYIDVTPSVTATENIAIFRAPDTTIDGATVTRGIFEFDDEAMAFSGGA